MSHDLGFKDDEYQYRPNEVNAFLYRFGLMSKNWYKNRFDLRMRYKEIFELLLSISPVIDKIERIINKKD